MTGLLAALAPLLLSAVLLHPAPVDDGPLRLVAIGIGDGTVEWTLDGAPVATTRDGEAAQVQAAAGPHELWATTSSRGRWQALARPDPAPSGAATAVPAWTAVHEAEPAPGSTHAWIVPAGAFAGGAALLARPRSLLQALRRARRR